MCVCWHRQVVTTGAHSKPEPSQPEMGPLEEGRGVWDWHYGLGTGPWGLDAGGTRGSQAQGEETKVTGSSELQRTLRSLLHS